jgi:Ala-tRNA(Pro) deacylase
MSETVVLKGDDRYLLVVVPAEFYVETGNVGSVAGISKLRIATDAEKFELFPFGEVGAVPPLGGLLGVPVYLDRKLADQEWIAFNAGTRRDLIRMKTADFQRIARTVIGPFGWPDYQKEFRSRLLTSVKEAGR